MRSAGPRYPMAKPMPDRLTMVRYVPRIRVPSNVRRQVPLHRVLSRLVHRLGLKIGHLVAQRVVQPVRQFFRRELPLE